MRIPSVGPLLLLPLLGCAAAAQSPQAGAPPAAPPVPCQ